MSAGLAIALRALAVIAVLAAGLAHAPLAIAGPGGSGGWGSGGQTGGVLTAGVLFAESDGSAGGSDGCSWKRADGDLVVVNNGTATWPRTDSETGLVYHLWEKRCGNQWAGLWEFPATDPAVLRDLALERLERDLIPSPEPVFEMLDPEFGWAYVRTPLDFRAGGDAWRTVSVTARLGPLWATAMAAPRSLTFDPGDPSGAPGVTCFGDAAVAPYVAEVPGECSYTYVNASSTSPFDGYHFLATLTIDWAVSWTSSTGAGGALTGYQSSASAEVAVAEAKGLVVCTGSRPEQGDC